MSWLIKKPEFTEDCILLTASKWKTGWEYNLYTIEKINHGDGWYWGIFDNDDEWGDIADLHADLYKVLSLIK